MEIDFISSQADISRKVFIKGIGYISASLLLSSLGGCEELAEAIRNRPMRRRLRTGSAEVDADINTYRQAVTLMKGLPNTDPRNWDKQAQIHGTVTGGFNLCQHGTDHFFSWHRAYLFYFEKICQKLTGNAKFGLPYWNWNQNPDIHPEFQNTTSPLFLARNNNSVAGVSAVSAAELNPIFADANFYTFSPQIEGTPHNTVHSFVGATMGTGGSALDPIFWAHHCMVDYCWAKWNIDLGNNNTNDPAWINTSWNHFVDGDGNPVNIKAGITTIMPLLSYQYENSNIGDVTKHIAIKTKRDFERLQKRLKEGANIRFNVLQRIPIIERATISIAKPFSANTGEALSAFSRLVNIDAAKEKVFTTIDFAQLPATSDFFVRVFVNLPDANTNTSTSDPHYAGSFAFFGTQTPESSEHMHQHQPRFLVNITPTLQKLIKSGELKDNSPLSIQLVAVPFTGKLERENTQLILNKLDLIVTPVIVNSERL